MFNRNFTLDREIQDISDELREIAGLKEMLKHPAWEAVEQAFGRTLFRLTREIDELCLGNVKKHADEIRMKRWVAKYLTEVLNTLREPLNEEKQLGERQEVFQERRMDVLHSGEKHE